MLYTSKKKGFSTYTEVSKIKTKKNDNKHKYLYETHTHSSQATACAFSTGAEMVRAYAERG